MESSDEIFQLYERARARCQSLQATERSGIEVYCSCFNVALACSARNDNEGSREGELPTTFSSHRHVRTHNLITKIDENTLRHRCRNEGPFTLHGAGLFVKGVFFVQKRAKLRVISQQALRL